LSIPIQGEDEEVTINLNESLEDRETLLSLLQSEQASKQAWLLIANAFSNKNQIDDAIFITDNAIQYFQSYQNYSNPNNTNDDTSNLDTVQTFKSFLIWLYIKKSRLQTNIDYKLETLRIATKILSDQNPFFVPNQLARSIIDFEKEEYELSLTTTEKILKEDPFNCFALFNKANIFFIKKNYYSAIKIYQNILIHNPIFNPDPRIGIGLCSWFLNDKELAQKSWERSLQLYPNNLTSNILLMILKFESIFKNSLQDQNFVNDYTSLINLVAYYFTQNKNNPILLIIFVSYLFSTKNYDLAENLILNFNKTENNLISSQIKSQINFWLARIYFAKTNYQNSLKYFQNSANLNNDNILSKFGIGQIQLINNNIEESILTFEPLIKSNQNSLEINYLLGLLYSEKADYASNNTNQSSNSSSLNSSSLTSNSIKKNIKSCLDKSISFLEKYIKLTKDAKELPELNSYLTLSKNYESIDKKKSLKYLQNAIELIKFLNDDDNDKIPPEILNNIGVLYYLNGNFESSKSFFEIALKNNQLSEPTNLSKERDITIRYNITRVNDNDINFFQDDSHKLSNDINKISNDYNDILIDVPNYIYANIRRIYLLSKDENYVASLSNIRTLEKNITTLLNENKSNLEVRAFYGWFLRTFNKKLSIFQNAPNKNENPESNHYIQTLNDHDSHDCYSLISLANVYLLLAREYKVRNSSDESKKNGYYIKSAELFQKVLSLDSYNIFAAQGIAIIFAELNDSDYALKIFRKIRDSLNDVSIFINLGHVLIDIKQYSKAIECYEIAITRFNGGHDVITDSKYFILLGRAWYARGMGDKSLPSLMAALEYSKKALKIAKKYNNKMMIPSLKFNIAFIQFQIADFIRKLAPSRRTADELQSALSDLEEGISTLSQLAREPNPPFSPDNLNQRATMGKNTIKVQVQNELNKQLSYEKEFKEKFEEAKNYRAIERARIEKENEEYRAKELQNERELYLKRLELDNEARKWKEQMIQARIDEEEQKEKKKKKRDDDFVENESEDNGSLFGDDEENINEKQREKEKEKRHKGEKGKGRRSGKRKESAEGDEESGRHLKRRLTQKRIENEKSTEFVEDSDEEIE
ncbi:Ctr9p, partial [Ascoidea rubescens DSM 1968]